jgi:subtilisin family serine protease/subtilisin-like proprotein convertase family protein
MSMSRFARRGAQGGRAGASALAAVSGRAGSLLETLESRVLLAADFSGVMSPELHHGAVLDPVSGVERVAWRGGSVRAVANSWVLTFDRAYGNDRAEALALEAAQRLGQQVEGVRSVGRGGWAQVDLAGTPSEWAIGAATRELEWLRAFEPNLVYEPSRIPNDPLFGQAWQLDNTGQNVPGSGVGTLGADPNMLEAWDITVGSRDVIIAVIDTGVDLDHPDLAANIWRNPNEIPGNGIDDDGNGFVDDVFGWDFGENNNDPSDEQGHGTAVAGTLGAVGNNGVGVTGVAWNISILPLKIADRFGRLTASAIIGSHDYLTMMITDYGHNIVASNNSYGAFAPSFYLDDNPEGLFGERVAIENFLATGASFVVASGNDANDNDATFTAYPASYDIPGLISVAATNNRDALAGFSNYGAERVDLGAPGEQVYTTFNGGGYGYISGTSFASPYVAGAVGLLKSHRPDASAVEIRQALLDSVDVLPSLQGRVVSGGRLNMARALEIIGTDGPVAIAYDPGPITSRLDANTGQPINKVSVTFNKDIDGSTLDADAALLTFAGADDEFGTGDDSSTLVPVSGVSLRSGQTRIAEVSLDLSGVPQQRLPLGKYRLTLFAGTSADPKFQDPDGNLLNGDATSGRDEEYEFEVVGVGGALEPNDTMALATPVAFGGSGRADFTGVTLGDGLSAQLDVDLYRITLPRGGLITAEVTAANLDVPSSLDSYLRLFDANGQELAANDQFNGRDAFLDFFVTTGGTYYVGVSGFPNTDYNPAVAGSGRAQSTGVYDIQFGFEQIVDDRQTFSRTYETPLPVPAVGTQGTQSSTITVNDSRAIKDVNLRLDLEHSFVSDLEITLIAPNGTQQVVFDRHGGNGEDFNNVLLDDEAAQSIVTATPPYSGSLKPTNGLNTFDGQSALGTWTLLIRDRQALNSGLLKSWGLEFTLENDIFGPFESNDTLSTARELGEIVGSGSASREAAIGDGGFGALDRDIFRFTVEAGATINASVFSGGTLNTSLRLFDEAGNELKSASPSGTLNSTISSFVFPAGGTYFIAVAEGSNLAYDPFDVTSGTPAQTTGDYRLEVSVSPGLSDPAATYSGSQVRAGLASDGTFGATDAQGRPVGIAFDGIDFLRDADTGAGLSSVYGLTANGFDFLNDGTRGATALPVSLTDQSGPLGTRVSAAGLFRGVRVERSVTLGADDRFIAIDVTLTNTGTGDATDVAWLETLDPNQGLNIDGGGRSTANNVDDAGRFAWASVTSNSYPEGATIALAAPAADSRALATFYDPNSLIVRDPSQVLEFGSNDPDGSVGDLRMALAYDIGTLESGASTNLRYFIFLGRTPDEALDLYDAVNGGTGEGHLASDSSSPAEETLSNGENAPTLPYRYYYPDGFSSPNIFSFVPMINPHDEPTRVVAIARYEVGERDDLIADFTIQPQARGGITTNTPGLFNTGFGNAGGSLVRPLEPYALEIRSERPIAATFSYFDLFLLGGEKAALGESFTATTSDTWTFASVSKAEGKFDFPVYLNTSDSTIKVTTTLLPTGGGSPIVLTQELGAHRRGGWNLSATDEVPAGDYGMIVEATGPIVASLSSYDDGTSTGRISASAAIGLAGLGATSGATPEGQIGLNSTEEVIGVTNANGASTSVNISFLFSNGSAYRTKLDVGARSRAELDVTTLPNFRTGEPYSIAFTSPLPVAMNVPTLIFEDGASTPLTEDAFSLWAFGEGFRPQNGFDQNVTEYLRVFNPSETETVIEITIRFDGNFKGTDVPLGQETVRRVVAPRTVAEFDIHDFVTGNRREQDVFYGLTVKGASPIVAYMGRFDAFFPGAFGTLGVPLGRIGAI